jgi:hypothetical protein
VALFRRIGEDPGQEDLMPFAVELYGRLGASSKSFLQALGNVALAHSTIAKAALC